MQHMPSSTQRAARSRTESRKDIRADNRPHRAWMLALLLAAAASLGSTVAHAADEESERIYLMRIDNELAQVQKMVAAASRDAPPARQVNFRYEWLMNDLDIMRRGIQQHLGAPRQPRPVQPLRGDYRQ